MIHWQTYLPIFQQGVILTLAVAVSAFAFGLLVATVLAYCEIKKIILFSKAAGLFNFLLRSLPELFIIFFIYFGSTIILSQLFGTYIEVNSFSAGVLALGLIFGSYASQVIVFAISTICKIQSQSGYLLGLSKLQVTTMILLPQIIQRTKTGMINLWLILLKDTALVSLIGIQELMQKAQIAASATRAPLFFYLIAGFIYLVLSTLSEKLLIKSTKGATC